MRLYINNENNKSRREEKHKRDENKIKKDIEMDR